jgi:hypothetical protein
MYANGRAEDPYGQDGYVVESGRALVRQSKKKRHRQQSFRDGGMRGDIA